ncbi:transposable element gene [Prunus dulcis]|uniref:Transposable element protein n=1 Tax=Prunus dulcis TaxID=3755 RepID=A0A5H2Y7E5_PRUDU|nr:transposable element gene [Prunus dulcis]
MVASKVDGKGKVVMKMTSGMELTLNQVLHVPDIRKNLVSGALLSKNRFRLVFVADKFVLTKNGMYVGKGYLNNGLFKMNLKTIALSMNNKNTVSSTYILESPNVWHGRLGHVNYDTIRRLVNMDLLPKFNIDTKPLDLIHSDICDLKFVQTRGGKKYFISFIDDCTRYRYVYLLRSKDETLEMFKHYKNEVENQLSKMIKVLRIDRGDEYVAPFAKFCAQHGIIHQTTNGIAERKNILEHPKICGEKVCFLPIIFSTNSYKYLKVWECLAKIALPDHKKVKIGPKTIDCLFIGYASNSSAYRFLIHKSNNDDVHMHMSRSSLKRTYDSSNLENHQDQLTMDMKMRLNLEEKEDIKAKVESILQNHTWELVDLFPGNKRLGYKWIFKRKMKAVGSIDKYKVRLVVKGYKQKEGLGYFDTYSPVTRITSIRMLIVIVALHNLEIHQMDVKTVFLNGDLEEEIYIEQPKGFVVPGQEKKVCKLVKSLYGLKQAPKQWHMKFDNVMTDKCVYTKITQNGYVIVCLYVDDTLIIGSDNDMIKSTKRILSNKFDMKDMGIEDVILGIKISRTSDGIVLSQSHYIEKILAEFGKYEDNPAKTTYDVNLQLTKNTGQGISQVDYARIIGSLMYVTNCTRPDLAYSVNKLSKYISNPRRDHWKVIIRVLRYLSYTKNYGLHYTRYPYVLEGYDNAKWISNTRDSNPQVDMSLR